MKIDFLGIGAQKAGTSWLAECLREHPDIYMPVEKELDYWNKTIKCISTRSKPLLKEEYLSFFNNASDHQVKGEFSTHYIYDKKSPELIYEEIPGVKIMVILRDPIKRALSHYQHLCKLLDLGCTFEKAVVDYPDILERGLYYKQLDRFFRIFREDQIMVLIFEEALKSPQESISDVYRFLAVDDSFVPATLEKKINVKKIVSNTFLRNLKNRIKNKVWGIRIIKMLNKLKLNKIFESLYLASDSSKYTIDEKTSEYLKKYYSEDVIKLESLLNKKISSWLN
jgi:hypothetical protein